MPQSNHIVFTHDWLQDPGIAPSYPTRYYRAVGPPSPGDIAAGGILKESIYFLGGLDSRVAAWDFALSFTLASGLTDDLFLTLVTGLANETALCQHQGWSATGLSITGFTCTVNFGDAIYNDAGEFMYCGINTQPMFFDGFEDTGVGLTSLSWGAGAGDNCPLTLTLPATGTGFITVNGFDGTGITTRTLQIGGREPTGGGSRDVITGTASLTPSLYWEHDPGDGDGPIYDSLTGAWLRDPKDPARLHLL